MPDVLEAITASGKSTCGRDLNYRIRVTKSDVVLSALDLTTNTYAEVARFDAGADPLPPEYLEVSDDPALVLRVTVAEGVTSWQIVDALKKADFLQGPLETVPPEGSLAPGGYEVERGMERGALISQMTQTAVCNRHHSLDQQLCRWLLLSMDRLHGNELVMTQELIANMLGVRREGVTEAAGHLQDDGLIQYRRGRITVLDRAGLEKRTCECYAVVKQEYDRLLPASKAT